MRGPTRVGRAAKVRSSHRRAHSAWLATLIAASLVPVVIGLATAARSSHPHGSDRPPAAAPQPDVDPSGLLRPGSDPSVLPANIMIADKANNRLLEVSPEGELVWSFPRPGDLAHGQTFIAPDDAFFTYDGRYIVATQEDDFVISEIDVGTRRIVYRYGHPGVPGSSAGFVYNPDDAIPLRDGTLVAADIKNCRLIELRPPRRDVIRQVGATGGCFHEPPASFGSPNGAFPLSDGGTVVTEITGNWVDVFNGRGKLVAATNPPGFSYPSDTNELRPGVYLSVDYARPGTIETFDAKGHVLWRFSPTGPDALNHPSLALPLPNGDILANDDYNDRVIVVDPRTNRIVWQYGHTGVPGTKPGYLHIPDGVDVDPPYALVDRFPGVRGLPGG
jgi:outer membrane protein assembly factor BamB